MIRPIILSKTDTFIVPLFESMDRHNRGSLGQTIVADNGLSPEVRRAYFQPAYVSVPNPFCFSKAVNLAEGTTRVTDHLMILNDDTEAATTNWLYRLENLIEKQPEYGIISCSIEGGAYNKQNIKSAVGEDVSKTDLIDEPEVTLAFIAVVISRACWNKVGPMDERFTGYGYEDNDYCLRARKAGFKTGITRAVIFKHGRDGQQHSSSFLKYNGTRKWNELRTTNQILFNEKWGIK